MENKEIEPVENPVIIEAKDLYVSFMITKHGINNFKDFLISAGARRPFERKQVLKGLNIKIHKGESFGIMGRNGSGKSTFLRAIAGIMRPDSGILEVKGRVAPMMAMNAGLEPEMTGEENIKFLGTLMGYSSKEIKQLMGKIIDFSELSSEEIQLQVKRYSSGMQARLAFSTTVAKDPEILIIDEALTVGDLGFKKKCAERIDEIRANGSTILYVSHNMDEIERVCTRAGFLKDGKIVKVGPVDEIIGLYKEEVVKKRLLKEFGKV